MDGVSVAPRSLVVRRGFEFSRQQQQLLALAYEQLLPIIRSPLRPRVSQACCLQASRCQDVRPVQEEPARAH
jgi:hypothetical protein